LLDSKSRVLAVTPWNHWIATTYLIMASCLLKFLFIITYIYKKLMVVKGEVPPRFELGLLDSESRVLAVTPWDLL
ncbi:hypothetical protein T01_5595, partial [Trichinella spiralis]